MGTNFTIGGTAKENLIDMAQCLLVAGEINLGWDDIQKVLLQDGEKGDCLRFREW